MNDQPLYFSPSRNLFFSDHDAGPADLILIPPDRVGEAIRQSESGVGAVRIWLGVDLPDPPEATIDGLRRGLRLSRGQVISGMAIDGLITSAEAVAAATQGTPPAAVDAMMALMPEPQQTLARVKWASFSEADRLDPMVALFAAARVPPLSDSEIDDFFVRHAAL